MDSRLLGAFHFISPKFAQVLEASMPKMDQGQLRGNLIGGGKVFQLGRDTSVHPAWRKAYTHLIQTGVGAPDAAALREFAPESGAYANEASPKQPNWKQAYWGANSARLSQIKTKYDPDGVFWITPGINADHWQVANGRLCPVASGNGASSGGSVPPANDNTNKQRCTQYSIFNIASY
jgi:hypothetical protein